ncbi:hypothetical protein ACFFGH_09060 [Lysobacter korlensis]|uniref:Toxin co-regulated pilus biosynthesis protein Q C-terminal domain-containing protein n=1 Tax=Lysobacter korlensis TaxID=553636 RepID=A0ABV6RLY4_9GAMM
MELPKVAGPGVTAPPSRAREADSGKPFDPHCQEQHGTPDAGGGVPQIASEESAPGAPATTHELVARLSSAERAGAALLDDAGTDTSVQLVLQVGGRELDVIDMPWRLCASGRFLTARADAVPALPTDGGSLTGGGNISKFATGYAHFSATAYAASAPAASGDVQAPAAVAVPTSPISTGQGKKYAGQVTVETAAAVAAAPDQWRERLWRCIELHGEATLYVRDYRLDAEARSELARRLADTAREGGLTLSRVVINGHVMAPASSGDSHAS